MEVDLVLADIIATDLSLDPTRVVVYNQNWDAPTDEAIFIIVATRRTSIISSSNHYDYDTDEEVKSVSSFIYIDIEITSMDRTALERKEEILMSLTSTYSLRQQEDNEISIFRTKDIIDLSEIDGSSALHRFRIPVIISQLKIKRTAVVPVDKFQPINLEVDAK